jgi:N-acetyl sugar amidotransferase
MVQCSKCVLDDLSPSTNISLDEFGVCNNCRSFEYYSSRTIYRPFEFRENELTEIINKIKHEGRGKKYDCVLGISGGIDSTYLAYLAKKYDLRPLVVHFDNGWDSELAISNIQNILERLNFELITYVIDWNEFKDLQLAYLKASVIDIEAPTDHFIYASLYEIAHKYGIKYILDGNNISTEFSNVSWKWNYDKLDLVNLENIHKKFGTVKLKKYPKLGFYQRFFYQNIVQIRQIYLLNYVDYNVHEVKSLIEKKLAWRDYGGKHYESVFTRFYQGYILPRKFGIDKRKAHLSNLIWSGQISRDEALIVLKQPAYPISLQNQDREYICKKLGLSYEDFESLMKSDPIPHQFYGTEFDKNYLFTRRVFTFLFSLPYMISFSKVLVKNFDIFRHFLLKLRKTNLFLTNKF